MPKHLSFLALLLSLSGCQTGTFIKGSPAALTDIRKAAVVVLGEPRSVSLDGREIVSKFHDRRGRMDEGLEKAKVRYYTLISILGDRRPYNIKVEVFQEAKVDPRTYQIIGENHELARKTASRLEEVLNESLKSRNVIDDFRAF
ncbi:MAG: hypothetical protein ACK5Y2_02040 [Bdellovibrionales bacterium]